MESVEFLIVGCGPAGGVAAREAARAGIETLVLEKDPVVGQRRVCAAGLRPAFLEEFDLPKSIVHCDPMTIAMHSPTRRHDLRFGPTHTTTREELDGTIAELARGEGAQIRTGALYRSMSDDGDATVVEYADANAGERRTIRAKHLFLAPGSVARLEDDPRFAYDRWNAGLVTCLQYRVYLERQAVPQTYQTLEMHYYHGLCARPVMAWMFPKRDHLTIGLGVTAKISGAELRRELDAFLASVERRLFRGIGYRIRVEGNLLYGGAPRPRIATDGVMIGGTAAGLVDATTGEGIYEAASSGRLAAAAVAQARRGRGRSAGRIYERSLKSSFFGRLRDRHNLMNFLERKPRRFDVLFEQLVSTPRFADLIQRDRDDYSLAQWIYLYAQMARFTLKAL
jgi:geranylgeranyl reductase